jgi:hypothetical protein
MTLGDRAHLLFDTARDIRDQIQSGRQGRRETEIREEAKAAFPDIEQVVQSPQGVPIGPLRPLNVEEGFDNGGFQERSFSPQGTPLLDSFYFQYTSDDHHLSQIMILLNSPQPGKMRVGFHDINLDDDYFFKVVHRPVVDSRIRTFSRDLDLCVGACNVPIDRPGEDFEFVLMGFQLAYQGAINGRDHHVNQVALTEHDGELRMRFGDKDMNTNVLWRIQYAYVPRDLFLAIGESSGVRERGGDRRNIQPGASVIRGFFFNFEPYFTSGGDHHIRDIGVTTPDDGRVEVFYEDKNGDDGFDWVVRWGVLDPSPQVVHPAAGAGPAETRDANN